MENNQSQKVGRCFEVKYSYLDFERLTSLPLEDKVLWTEQVILNALKQSKNPSISCSWGKDSVVMVYLVRKFCKKAKVIFANTLCEYKETYQYRDGMLAGFFKGMDYYETKPIKDFWQCVKEYGFPNKRESWTVKGEKANRTPKCCFYLKEYPLKEKQKDLGVDTVFIGLQATESMNRRLLFLRLGEFYHNKEEKINHCLPLAIWKDKDVFAYAEQQNIPMNAIYKIMKRNGCMFCTGFKNWQKVMAKYNQKLYASILKEKTGQMVIQNCQ